MNKHIVRVKKFIDDHAVELASAGVTLIAIGLYVQHADKVDKERRFEKKLRDYTIQENHKGRTVFKLEDGGYISVWMADAEIEAE